MQYQYVFKWDWYKSIFLTVLLITFILHNSSAFPLFAQQKYANPIDATERIACANCHLAKKQININAPQTVYPNTLFDAILELSKDIPMEQVTATGKRGKLNAGAVLIMPPIFKLAPTSNKLPSNTSIQQYGPNQENILILGPVSINQQSQVSFPITVSSDVNNSKQFQKHALYAGANQGRGQLYPDGQPSNNTFHTTPITGTITQIVNKSKGGFEIEITGKTVSKVDIPPGPLLLISTGQKVAINQKLTNDPNVGGFGQAEREIILQNPIRLLGLLSSNGSTTIAQLLLVFKKKQVERMQMYT